MKKLPHFPNPFGGVVWHLRETTSTMDESARLLAGNSSPDSLHGVVVMADFQSAGRGRFGHRQWQAAAGDSLLFTIILRPVTGLPLSLCLGLAVCRYLESEGLRPSIKWPNDILLDEQKLAGVLVSGTNRIMQCGIGINLRTPELQSIIGQRPATGLAAHGLYMTAFETLEGLLPFLFEVTTGNGEGLHREIEKRLWLLNQRTTIIPGFPQSIAVTGIVRGIAADGALLLETQNGLQAIHSGE